MMSLPLVMFFFFFLVCHRTLCIFFLKNSCFLLLFSIRTICVNLNLLPLTEVAIVDIAVTLIMNYNLHTVLGKML